MYLNKLQAEETGWDFGECLLYVQEGWGELWLCIVLVSGGVQTLHYVLWDVSVGDGRIDERWNLSVEGHQETKETSGLNAAYYLLDSVVGKEQKGF